MIKPQFENTSTGLIVRAPAKLNLSLLIAGKRSDGFHEIETVMTKINAYDEILIEPIDKPGIELVCQGPCWAPAGPDNLVYQAAQKVLADYPQNVGLRLTLTKNIPAGTGLGTASSDAAATLLGIVHLLDVSATPLELHAWAASLGSDIPFFLGGPWAYCTGRGEKITPLNVDFSFHATLIIPSISVSTVKVYKNYQHSIETYITIKQQIQPHISKNRIDLLAEICPNMLSSTCYKLETKLSQLKCRLESLDCGPIRLSGSGSAMYCITEGGIEEARKIHRTIDRATDCQTFLVRNIAW